jgi:5'-phosphate synthase pdxT subunit
MLVGVLALQGDVSEHVDMLKRLLRDDEVRIVKWAEDIPDLDGLVIPGGESTTVGKLVTRYGIDKEIKKHRDLGIFGTCTGAILLAKKIMGLNQFTLGLMDVVIERNAYGRQRESFEADLEIPKLGKRPFRGVFIRAPIIREAGEGVEILARYNGDIVLARQGRFLAATFHPELTDDVRLHKYFLTLLK